MAVSKKSGSAGGNRTFRRGRYFARRVIHPWQRPAIMRKHIYTGAMGNMYFMLMSGIFFVYFAKRVGLADRDFGLLGGVSSFLLSFQLLSALITQRGGRRKRLWFWCALVGRIARILGILLAFLLWHAGFSHAGVIVMGGIWLANVFGALSMPPWMSWLADIIPKDEHGGFWGRRTQWISLSVMLVTLSAGLLMDATPESDKLATSVAILMVAGVIGVADILIHGTIPEPRMRRPNHGGFLQQILEPLRDRGFRPWLIFNMCWTYSMWLGGVMFMVFIVEHLGIKHHFLGGVIVMTCVTQLAAIFTSGWTGRLVDRLGPKKVLRWGHLFWALNPICIIAASPRTVLAWLAASSVMVGIAFKAAMTAGNKLVTRYPPPGHRAMYVAVSSCLGSFAGGLGALTAGGILTILGDAWQYSFGGKTFTAFHVIFIASLVLRVATVTFLAGRINDPGEHDEE